MSLINTKELPYKQKDRQTDIGHRSALSLRAHPWSTLLFHFRLNGWYCPSYGPSSPVYWQEPASGPSTGIWGGASRSGQFCRPRRSSLWPVRETSLSSQASQQRLVRSGSCLPISGKWGISHPCHSWTGARGMPRCAPFGLGSWLLFGWLGIERWSLCVFA